MAITGAPGGTAYSTTAGTTLSVFAGTGANWLPGDLIVVIVGCDNSGAGGASPLSTVVDSRAHLYSQRWNIKKSNGVQPNDSPILGLFTAVVGSGGLASSDVITIHFNTSTPSRAVVVWQFRSSLGAWDFNPADKTDEGYGTAISWSGFTVNAGHCVIGCGAAEYNATPGGDSDTQYGTWSTKHYRFTNFGSAITSTVVTSQWKVPNATGTQQFTATVGSSSVDWVSLGFVFRDTAPATTSATASAQLGTLSAQGYAQVLINQVVASASADLGELYAEMVGTVTLRGAVGCPFTRADQPAGNWAPGWLIVIDAFYAGKWSDLTRPSFHVELGDGMAEGEPRVTVGEVVVSLVDPSGQWVDMDDPAHPQPGSPLRVALIDPARGIHPLISAELERIEDTHDGDHPRTVQLRGFGKVINLVVDVPGVSLPAGQLASERFVELARMAGWIQHQISFPPGDTPLIGAARVNVILRDEMDRTCQSAGWFMDSDRFGSLRVRQWPHEPELDSAGLPLMVTDCEGTDELVSHSIAYANDESHLLNYVVTTNDEILNVVVEHPESIAVFGRRGRAYGFPLMGLAWSDEVAARQWASRAAQRFAWITRQVESFEVDTHVDQRWLTTLADLDTGRAVAVRRSSPTPLELAGVITGWRYQLDPGRFTGTLFVSTITESEPDVTAGGLSGKATASLGGVAPNDYLTVIQQSSWAGIAWPAVGSFADISVDGTALGRYQVSTTMAGTGKLYHTATELRLGAINQDGQDNRAFLQSKLNLVVTVTWANVTPTFRKPKELIDVTLS